MIPHWKAPQSELLLGEEDVHIWQSNLDAPMAGFQTLYQTLSIDERKRAERFHFEKDRRRFIVGRGVLRTILGCYLSIEPGLVRFCYGKYGKPVLAETFGDATIHFNMSRSEGLALYAFTRGHEIGVDIEYVRDIAEMDEIAERFFSRGEKAVFRSLPENMKREAFFVCWTRKEAFIKAIGRGLYQPLDTFDVSAVPGEPARLLRIEENSEIVSQWFIQDLRPALGLTGALAVRGCGCRLHRWQWSG